MHFYGMGWQEVERMPLSQFFLLLKSARTIEAQQTLVSLRVSDYPHTVASAREKFFATIKDATTEFVERKVLDYKTVVQNLAKRIMSNGR